MGVMELGWRLVRHAETLLQRRRAGHRLDTVTTEPLDIDVAAWGPLIVRDRVAEGDRSSVWRGSLADQEVSIRRSRRSPASLAWELDLIGFLAGHGMRVPSVIPTLDGRSSLDGVVVQRWMPGRAPASSDDWRLVADILQRLHDLTRDYVQRPDCCAVAELTRDSSSVDADLGQMPDDAARDVLAVFAQFEDHPRTVIHGDPGPGNIRIDDDGHVGLLDFDESRVDVAWHDLSNLGVQVLNDDDHAHALRLSDAWEAANGWIREPAYARTRLESLRRAP